MGHHGAPLLLAPQGAQDPRGPPAGQSRAPVPSLLPPVPVDFLHAALAEPGGPTTALEERQRKPITVDLILTSSHGNRIYYRTWNGRSWKRALAAGLIKPVGEKVRHDGDRIRRVPRYAAPREDMFHVLRLTYASVQLEAGESAVSLSKWLGHSTPKVTLDHYAHFMPGAGQRGLAAMDAWLRDPSRPKVPDKSLLACRAAQLPTNMQVKGIVRQGADMSVKYKETARGGLAVNIIEC
ncbi:hypothetical protein ACFV5G_11790 [Streptomyces sp. NPDC059766]|uniref:hypothetical protein n=1 Tax=Streptomyces sp. NPDC059766 TaxID=3346940 RepID=UPI0036639608